MSESVKPLTWQQQGSFLPEDYVRGKAERRANLLSLSLFGVMMFAVIAAFFATNKRWMTVRDEKRSINALYVQEAGKIDELKALEAQRDELIKKAEVTAALIERVPRSLLFAEVVRRMPEDVKLLELGLESEVIKKAAPAPGAGKSAGVRTLSGSGGKQAGPAAKGEAAKAEENSLVPEYKQTLSLVGVGTSNDAIANYIESLKECSILTGVELQFIKETKIEDSELRKFELRAQVRTGIDARGLIDPENPIELPEALSPDDLVPATPIFLPPSQPVPEQAAPSDPLTIFGGLFGSARDIGKAARELGADPETGVEPDANVETQEPAGTTGGEG